jgi:hypothetical protein
MTTPAPATTARVRGPAAPFQQLLLVWLLLSICLAAAFLYASLTGLRGTEAYYLLHQDTPVYVLCVAITAALAYAPGASLARFTPGPGLGSSRWVWAAALLCCAAGVAGARWVFQGYTLALDEFMANFDAQIFASGRLMAPIPPQWRPFTPALQPYFVTFGPHFSLWSSSYLPVNAAMRAAAGLVGLKALVNPLWTGLSVVLVYAVARRLWPPRPRLAVGAAVLLASSSQLVITGMTAYAMPPHLALNLAWLWCFLRGGRIWNGLAMVAAFLACGLHQILFHPLFAAPFVLQLWLDRRWRLAAVWTGAYAVIGFFWANYVTLEMGLSGLGWEAARAYGGHLAAVVLSLLQQIRLENFGAMAESMVRFVTWQNPLVAPLLLIGAAAAFRAKGHLRALAAGLILAVVAMLILEPSQVNGWGYRYLHGFLGSACLIAVWTWARLTDPLTAEHRAAANGAFVLAALVSFFGLTPLRAWQAGRYVRPYAAADAEVRSATAQVVIVDFQGPTGFDPGTIVRNDPFLMATPKVMELFDMNEPMVRLICGRTSVQVFDGADAARLGMDTVPLQVGPRIEHLRAVMRQLHCARPLQTRLSSAQG